MVTDRKQQCRQRLGATSSPDFGYTKRHARICPNTFNSDKLKERLGSGCLFRIVVPLLLGSRGEGKKDKEVFFAALGRRGEENKSKYFVTGLLQTLTDFAGGFL